MPDPNTYDTTPWITSALQEGIDGFRTLVAERHRAGYDRRERLSEFTVLHGRFRLDSCGNLLRVFRPNAGVFAREMVLADPHGIEPIRGRPMYPASVPSGKCAICLRRWDLENMHDARDVRPENDGDPWTWEHWQCQALATIDRGADMLRKIVAEAAHDELRVDAIRLVPNRYHGDRHDQEDYPVSPWCIIDTRHGPIRMGWRKRVIHIDWADAPGLARVRGADIVAREDITHDDNLVHCYGAAAASTALAKIMQAAA